MRTKDDTKNEAIIKATVELVNRIGFVSSSVAKIAKAANVSPATIYIYYKNKDDLLVSTYMDIKQLLSQAMLKNFDETKPIRDIFELVWHNSMEFIKQNREYFYFTEQFSSSPYSSLVDKKKAEKHFAPIINVLQRGIEQKILKDVPFEMLTVFMFYPVTLLSNPRICGGFDFTKENLDTAFSMAWDAVKL